MSIVDTNDGATFEASGITWNPPGYRCHIALMREADGSFSAIVLNLPGAGSCGDTEEDAIAGAGEAVIGVTESYAADGQEVPWVTEYDIPGDAVMVKWILVNA